MTHLSEGEWVAIAAHHLQFRWRSIDPGDLEVVAADLWRDQQLRDLEPVLAVDAWLAPIMMPPPLER